MSLEMIHAAGAELEELYCLKTAPLAIKLIDRDEIPEGCTQPSKEGKHYALCQALAFSRRTRNGLAVFAEDHWCLWPVINFRLRALDEADKKYVGSTYFIRDPEVSYRHFCEEYPYIDEEKAKEGMAIAPLESCTFEPDAVMVYCEPSQLRQLLMASKFYTGNITGASFDTCDSCGAALLPVLNGRAIVCPGHLLFVLLRPGLICCSFRLFCVCCFCLFCVCCFCLCSHNLPASRCLYPVSSDPEQSCGQQSSCRQHFCFPL